MSLPTSPPRYASWGAMLAPIKRGETGWRVYAVQVMVNTTPDGNFGPDTEAKVKSFQSSKRLTADGIVGPTTQGAMLRQAEHDIHGKFPSLPEGTLRGFADAEGAGILAATNWYTPPGGAPGVDCGPVQQRQYGPPFAMNGLRDAFNPRVAFGVAAGALLARVKDYDRRRPTLSDKTVLRIAVLAHNAPFLAEQVVRNGKLSTPDKEAVWTRKPSGGHYTHAEWMEVYPNAIMRHVAGWA